MEAQGIKGSYLSLGAMKRGLFSGGGIMMPYEGQYQDGDTLGSFNWEIPILPKLLFRSENTTEDKNEGADFGDVVDITLEALGDSAGDFAIGFTPSLMKAGAQALDCYAKDTPYAGKGSLSANVKASLPILRNKLPKRYDIVGDAMAYYEPAVMNRLISFVNPAYASKVEQSDDINMILKVVMNDEVPMLPSDKVNSFKYNGTNKSIKKGSYELNPEEYSYYKQQYIYHVANIRSPEELPYRTDISSKRAQEDVIRKFKLKPILPKSPQTK